ncbi:hypothetical protein AB1Y20_010912 [Prymnesium parvum]|uniref:Protein RFT1 homolog n=1 Tax=Prymnesium parvum TaxID=97485 RepID=A0AB34IR23_PRYPA
MSHRPALLLLCLSFLLTAAARPLPQLHSAPPLPTRLIARSATLMSAAAAPPPSSKFAFVRLLLSVAPHGAAAVLAGFELCEDVSELGHSHGMLLLLVSRLCREVNVLQESLREMGEDAEESSNSSRLLMAIRSLAALPGKLLRPLASHRAAAALAVAAVFAAAVEVWQDIAPGGHHGALLLALNELLEISETIAGNLMHSPFLVGVLENHWLRLGVLAGAAVLALIETGASVASRRIGAHHGVALLSLIKVAGLLQRNLVPKHKRE